MYAAVITKVILLSLIFIQCEAASIMYDKPLRLVYDSRFKVQTKLANMFKSV